MLYYRCRLRDPGPMKDEIFNGKFINQVIHVLYFQAGFNLAKGKLLKQIPIVERQWYLSFDIQPGQKVLETLGSILNLTIGGDPTQYGNRITAVFLKPKSTELMVCTTLGTNKDNCYNIGGNLQSNKFTNVQIRQTWDTKHKVYKSIISFDNEIKHSVNNPTPLVFRNVNLWAADPWNNAADAIIRNLVFKNLPNGRHNKIGPQINTKKLCGVIT